MPLNANEELAASPEPAFNLDFSGLETSDVLNDFDFDAFLNTDDGLNWKINDPNLPDAREIQTDYTISEDLAGGKQARKDRDLKLLLRDDFLSISIPEASEQLRPSRTDPDEIRFKAGCDSSLQKTEKPQGQSLQRQSKDTTPQKFVETVPRTRMAYNIANNARSQVRQDSIQISWATAASQKPATRKRKTRPTDLPLTSTKHIRSATGSTNIPAITNHVSSCNYLSFCY